MPVDIQEVINAVQPMTSPTQMVWEQVISPEQMAASNPSDKILALSAARLSRLSASSTLRPHTATVDTLISEAYEELYSKDDWNGYGAQPLDKQSIMFAGQLLKAIPEVELPSLDPNPNGLLGLYWHNQAAKLILDINAEGVLSFAFRSKDGSSYSGKDCFFSTVPKQLVSLLRENFPKRT